MSDHDPIGSVTWGAERLGALGLAYLHLIDPPPGHFMAAPEAPSTLAPVRAAYGGVLIVNGGFDRERANAVLASGQADAVAFGVPFLANPDLPARLRAGAPLNPPDPQTFYSHDEKGYLDYPPLS